MFGAGPPVEEDAVEAMPPLSPQQLFSAPEMPTTTDPEERPPSPGEQSSALTQPLGEDSQLAAFKTQHHFTFQDRIVFKGRKSAAYSIGLNGDLDVSNLVEQIRMTFRELKLGELRRRTFRLGLYFSYILRTDEGLGWYSPSFNTSVQKNNILFPISGAESYVQLERYLREVPIVDRLSVGLSRASRDSLAEVATCLIWWFW
jgi:hypothetical protein